jgi:hypothetical protein
MAMTEGRYEYNRYGNELGIDLLGTPELVLNPVVGARVALRIATLSSSDWGDDDLLVESPLRSVVDDVIADDVDA